MENSGCRHDRSEGEEAETWRNNGLQPAEVLHDRARLAEFLPPGRRDIGYTISRLPRTRERYRRRQIDKGDVVWYVLLPLVGYVLYCDAGIRVLKVGLLGRALDGLASASVLLLVIGVRNAWDLVVWMVLRRAERSQ
ncbi:MAG: hypothetical protein E6H04_14480 [Bacillati bacterium ANGP1]|uniref:Uncharacterized protein n=1 Tax=Candidatus Segetimicrobium genomatis TaxID=2569760 RepID=A0A537J0U0_9BACT|nr:MAG: hypothetical protein E6H04_14480 [Terrabacteria group bacterium ANGP1]